MHTKKVQVKISFVSILLLTLASTALSQKYKEKDDVIYLDKAVVGKVSGEPTFKSTLIVYGLQGEEVLTIKPHQFLSNNMFLENRSWYTVRFSDTNKILTLYYHGACRTKCVLNNVLAHNDINLDGGLIKGQDVIIRKHDVTKEITKDTAEISNKHRQMISLLKNNKILRGMDKPALVFLERESIQGYTTTSVYNITQDNIILGRIVKTHETSPTNRIEKYIVYEKLYEPVGEVIEVPACKVTTMLQDLEFWTTVDGKNHKILITDRSKAIDVPKLLGSYLVANGYL